MIDTTKPQHHASCNLSNQWVAIPSTPACQPVSLPLLNWEQEQKQTSLDALHFLVTLRPGPKETAWVNPFANKKGNSYPSPSLRTPTEYINIAFLLKKTSVHLRVFVISHHLCIQSTKWECSVFILLLQGQIKASDVPLFTKELKSDSSLFSSLGFWSTFPIHFLYSTFKIFNKEFKAINNTTYV